MMVVKVLIRGRLPPKIASNLRCQKLVRVFFTQVRLALTLIEENLVVRLVDRVLLLTRSVSASRSSGTDPADLLTPTPWGDCCHQNKRIGGRKT